MYEEQISFNLIDRRSAMDKEGAPNYRQGSLKHLARECWKMTWSPLTLLQMPYCHVEYIHFNWSIHYKNSGIDPDTELAHFIHGIFRIFCRCDSQKTPMWMWVRAASRYEDGKRQPELWRNALVNFDVFITIIAHTTQRLFDLGRATHNLEDLRNRLCLVADELLMIRTRRHCFIRYRSYVPHSITPRLSGE